MRAWALSRKSTRLRADRRHIPRNCSRSIGPAIVTAHSQTAVDDGQWTSVQLAGNLADHDVNHPLSSQAHCEPSQSLPRDRCTDPDRRAPTDRCGRSDLMDIGVGRVAAAVQSYWIGLDVEVMKRAIVSRVGVNRNPL